MSARFRTEEVIGNNNARLFVVVEGITPPF
jgi:hypothetical protein